MKRYFGVGLGLVLACSLAHAQKKRVAVMNFDYATVQSGVQAIFGTSWMTMTSG